jgi:hypothetical protein
MTYPDFTKRQRRWHSFLHKGFGSHFCNSIKEMSDGAKHHHSMTRSQRIISLGFVFTCTIYRVKVLNSKWTVPQFADEKLNKPNRIKPCILLKSNIINLQYHQISSQNSVYFSSYAKMNSEKHVKYLGRHSPVPFGLYIYREYLHIATIY